MLQVEPVQDFERPELAPYRTMRREAEHRRQRLFVAEGEKVVRRLLESEFEVVSLLLPEKWLNAYQPLLERRPEPLIRVFTAGKALLETLTGYSMYQGVLGLGRVPAPRTLDHWLAQSPRPCLLVAVDGLTSAENLGSLVRNAAAFETHLLIVGETSSSPFLRRAVRASMGTVFKLPVFETDKLVATLYELRRRGLRCVAAHPHAPQLRLSRCNLQTDCCLVFGSEGAGLSPAVLAACDEAVAVPMQRGVDSLNVGSASAVFLYEVSRQRGQA